MGRYTTRQTSKPLTPAAPHYIWNGLGCLMLIVVPVISIAISVLIVNLILHNRWPFPYQLLGYPRFPSQLYATTGLAAIFGAIASINNLYAYIAVSLLVTIILSGIVSFLYALVYRVAGPPKYGPMDAPPLKNKAKPYKR